MRSTARPASRVGQSGLRGLSIEPGTRPSSTGRMRFAAQAIVSPSGTERHPPRPLLEAEREQHLGEWGRQRLGAVDPLECEALDPPGPDLGDERSEPGFDAWIVDADQRLER